MTEDSKDVTFLNYLYKHYGIETNYDKIKRSCSCQQQQQKINEYLLWVPKEAFKFVNDLAQKYNGKLFQESIENLLFGLNKIWTQREERKVKSLIEKHAEEVNLLKKQLDSNTPFDELQAKRKVHRLR